MSSEITTGERSCVSAPSGGTLGALTQLRSPIYMRNGISFLLEIVLDPVENFLGVFSRFDLGIDLADDALLVDHEGNAIGEAASR